MPNVAIAFNYMFPTNVATKKKNIQGTHLNIQQWRKNLSKNKNNSTQDATHTQ